MRIVYYTDLEIDILETERALEASKFAMELMEGEHSKDVFKIHNYDKLQSRLTELVAKKERIEKRKAFFKKLFKRLIGGALPRPFFFFFWSHE